MYLSEDAVFPSVARFTQVLAYDRPGVRFEGADLSTPVPQPHTVEKAVDDLHALLLASKLPGPYVLVSHSYGGLIGALYARRHPESVAGLVMVDAASEWMEDVLSPEKFAFWDEGHRSTSDGHEAFLGIDACRQIRAAGPVPKVPAIVLSADKWLRLDLLPPEIVGDPKFLTFADWLAGQGLLASALGGDQITKTSSGHLMMIDSPAVVIDAVRQIVERVRQ